MQHYKCARKCSHCESSEELVSDVVIKSSKNPDMREVATICGNCFWPKSRIISYLDKKLQEEAEKPFIEYGKRAAEFLNKKWDETILEALGV